MKKLFLMILLPSFLIMACNKEETIQPTDLPADASSYITTHYAGQQILQVVKERDDLRLYYFVYLNNGTKLEFNREGEIREIEGSTAIPATALPVLIVSYVETNYPGTFIKAWQIDDTSQDVELSNNSRLEFDKNGNFLRVE